VFRRDPSTGELTLLETKMDGADGFVSLTRFFSLAISPDGRNVYSGEIYGEPVIVIFDRQPTGALRATHADVGLPEETTQSLAITSDGRIVFAGGAKGIRVFERAPSDGRLSLLETVSSVDAGFGECTVGASVAVDPSGTHVYAGSNDCGILTFRRSCGDGVLDGNEACDDGNLQDGDGCDALCRPERCFTCMGVPSVCTPNDGIPCGDGTACVGDGHCLAGQCVGRTEVADGTPCDDRDACSVGDRCVAGACSPGSAPACGPCEACDHRFGCVGATRAGCSSSPLYTDAVGEIDLRLPASGRRKIAWRWGGFDYTRAPLGDPAATTGYTFCAIATPFDTLQTRRGRVLAAAHVPAGATCGRRSCWQQLDRGGIAYRDGSGRNDGVRRIVVKPATRKSTTRKLTRVTFAAGPNADLRALPPDGIVTAQLASDAGGCWSTTYRYGGTSTSRRFNAHAGCDSCNER
jgi:cysteine-rich repeat protein